MKQYCFNSQNCTYDTKKKIPTEVGMKGVLDGLNEIEEAMSVFNACDENYINSEIQKNRELKQRSEDLNQIKENVSSINNVVGSHTAQISQICSDLNQTKNQCDIVNRQLLQFQIDSQARDKANSRSAAIATVLSVLGLLVGAVGAVAGIMALFKE